MSIGAILLIILVIILLGSFSGFGGSGIYDLPRLTNAQSKTSPWAKHPPALLAGEIEGLPIARFPSTKILPAR
jgi:hypothetical protein